MNGSIQIHIIPIQDIRYYISDTLKAVLAVLSQTGALNFKKILVNYMNCMIKLESFQYLLPLRYLLLYISVSF